MRPKNRGVGEYCVRDVVVVAPDTPIKQCAKLMHDHHIGSVVVIQEKRKVVKPVGIVTDRDITIEVVAFGLDAATLTAEDFIRGDLAVVQEGADLLAALALMREHGVRRLPVVGHKGALVGIISADDLITLIAGELDGLASTLRAEFVRERETRRAK